MVIHVGAPMVTQHQMKNCCCLSLSYFIFFHFNSKETNNGKNFETVKHGSRTLESLADRRPRLDLENKFDALGRS